MIHMGRGRGQRRIVFLIPIGILLLLILLYSPQIINALSFTVNPTITPSEAYTTTDLTCTWNLSIDATSWNASWYNGSTLFKKYSFNTTNPGYNITLSHLNTSKHEIWKCVVNATNGSITISGEDSIEINNSMPDTLSLFYYNSTSSQWVLIEGPITIMEDQEARFDINGTDPDNDPLTYMIFPSSFVNYSLDSSTGLFVWTPVHSEVGLHILTFLVKDSEGIGLNKDYNITVQEVNDKPYFSPSLQDQVVVEGNCSWQYIIYGTDEETPNGPFNFSIYNITPSLSTNLSIDVLSDNKSARIYFDPCPTFFDRGNHTVIVVIEELNDTGLGLESNNASFNIEVIPVNHAPNISIVSNATGKQGQAFYYEFNATDLDNDTIIFSITPLECTSSISNPWINYLTYNTTYSYGGGSSSFGKAVINISASNFTNDFVVCSGNVLLIASDGKENSTRTAYFNITNINDPPTLHEISNYDNYLGQKNISNLTAYANTLFHYRVNATDPDLLLLPRFSEALNYSTNDSRIPIDSSTGWINLTPNESMIGNYTINITVKDLNNSMDSIIMYLYIKNNTIPELRNISIYYDGILNYSTIGDSITSIQGYEDRNLLIDINATDKEDCPSVEDCGNITYSLTYSKIDPFISGANSSVNISINSTTGIINITPKQLEIGLYNLSITITDSLGAVTTKDLLLYINYTNDKPNIDSVIIPDKIVVDHPAVITVYASDEDLNIPQALVVDNNYSAFNESLELFTNISWDYTITKINSTSWQISFTPNQSLEGGHSIKIWINDSRDNSCVNCSGVSEQSIDIEILARTLDPRIENISIYDLNNSVYILNWTSTWNPDISEINVSTSENRSILINTTGWNDELSYDQLNFTWIMDNTTLTTTGGSSRIFDLDFFSQGSHEIIVIVEDTRMNKDNITISLNVSNINRPPVLLNPLLNLSGNNSIDPYFEDPEYFTGLWNTSNVSETAHFYDPDLEELTIDIAQTTCNGIADIEINGSGIKVYGRRLGSCWAIFRAKDPYGESITSNNVSIEVTDILPAENVQVPSSGGGATTTQQVPVPIPEEIERPDPISIIAPSLVTIYSNRSIDIPIVINNT